MLLCAGAGEIEGLIAMRAIDVDIVKTVGELLHLFGVQSERWGNGDQPFSVRNRMSAPGTCAAEVDRDRFRLDRKERGFDGFGCSLGVLRPNVLRIPDRFGG